MAKFIVVDKAPEKLVDGEHVINMPDFVPEIKSVIARNRTTRTNGSDLRSIGNMIAIKYDRELDALRHLKVHAYEGIEYKSPEELSSTVLRMLNADYPAVFDKYIEHEIKNRPFGTKLIYFTGPLQKSSIFFKEGVDLIDAKDVESYMTGKPKRTVGKPAVSNKPNENESEGQ